MLRVGKIDQRVGKIDQRVGKIDQRVGRHTTEALVRSTA